jgi:hypothetical protein
MRKSLTLALTAALIGVIAPSQASDDPELVFTADFEEVRESHSAQAGPFDSADASVSAAIDGTATLTSETFNRYSSEAWARADILAPTFEWDDSSLILEATVSYTYRYDGSTFLTTTHGLDLTETALFAIRDDLGEASLVPEPEVWRPKFSSTALARFSETAHHIEEGTFTVSSLFQNRCGGAARIKPVLTAMTELSNPARLFPKWDAESVALFVEVEEIRVYRTALVPCQTVHTIEVVENHPDPRWHHLRLQRSTGFL